jgi:hypothetical protein
VLSRALTQITWRDTDWEWRLNAAHTMIFRLGDAPHDLLCHDVAIVQRDEGQEWRFGLLMMHDPTNGSCSHPVPSHIARHQRHR